MGENLSGEEAIKWALKYGHTTKTGNISGGLGLDIMFQFIQLNKGQVQIVSSDGYWKFSKDAFNSSNFDNAFPGTIVNINFNLSDESSYMLKEEISIDDIFQLI